MATKLSIWNQAIDLVGGAEISSTNVTDNSPIEARSCNTHYDNCLKSLLRMHAWNFSKRKISLEPEVIKTNPVFNYKYSFELPEESLRVIRPLLSGGQKVNDFEIIGNIIEANVSSLQLTYIQLVSEDEIIDPFFEGALAAFLAWKIGPKLTDKPRMINDAFNAFRYNLTKGRSADAIEDGIDYVQSNTLLDAFHGQDPNLSLAARQGVGDV